MRSVETKLSAKTRYDLLAIDLDGTLLDRESRVSARNAAAVRAAREAGIGVVVCTGRGLIECEHLLAAIAQEDPVVVAGGSIIACPKTKRTLHRAAIDQGVVTAAVDALLAHNHAALILKDPIEAGYDYLVVQGDDAIALDPVTLWWFESMNVRVRYAARLEHDEHPEHTVRVGACGMSGTMTKVRGTLEAEFAGRAFIHNFPAVVAPDHASRVADRDHDSRLHVLEVFDPKANKWDAMLHLARERGVEASRIAAIGDEINDVPMIAGAGLGIAMGNAVPTVREAAKKHTARNDEDGVALAIERILSGEW